MIRHKLTYLHVLCLVWAEKVLRHVHGINMVYFSDQDVVRHDLVGRIVKAYDAYHERKLAGETTESNAVSKENVAKG